MRIQYDTIRFVYATPIWPHTRDALATAATAAVRLSEVNHSRFGVVADGYAFRVIDNTYSTRIDPDGDVYGSRTQLDIIAFPVIKHTPQGFRIWRGHNGHGDETRFVSHHWTKSWAALTPDGALKDYAARRRRQAAIYEARAAAARAQERAADALLHGWKGPPTSSSS